MAFAVEDYYDLLRLLSEHPEWRAELRRAILPDDFQSLPDALRKLADAQRRTEAELINFKQHADERFGRLEEAMARLVVAQERTEERLGRLEEAMTALAERTGRLEEAMTALAERTGRLEEAVARLTAAQERTEERLARMEPKVARTLGITLEWQYREKAAGYFSMLRRPRVVARDDLYDLTEGILNEAEQRDLGTVDLVIRGRLSGKGEMPEVLLAVEVSATLDDGDVTRAARRASLLRKAGLSAIPVVAGEELAASADLEAGVRRVAIVQDGSTRLWEEALSAWPPLV